MASRTLSVALRAVVAGYTGPMRTAAAATGPLEASLMRVQRAGDGMSRVGSTLTRSVTLPIAAVGLVATKMAADFDKSFTTMQTLAGVTGDEVEGLKDKVLDLAGETGRAPQELAEALYFLQSSGLDSAQAMDALEVSAKGSAAGLGETQVIADAVSSAMLGYAASGLTAAEATDVLVATARAGKAEPAELAAQMGRLVPIASELGITFDQVGGAIAALSTKGFNAEQATTALTNVMAKLLKPSQLAVNLLDDVGLSVDGIREMIAEKGLLSTLEELQARLGDAGFVKFLEDQQAVQGGLALLGGDLEATKGIMDEVANSAGATDEAFGIWAESMGAKNAQAFAEFQVALIRFGEVLLPIASDVLSFAAKIAEAFSGLPGPAQKAIVVIGLVAAAVGPLLSIGGTLVTTFGLIARTLSSFVVPAGTVSGAFNTLGASANVATASTGKLAQAMRFAASPVGLFVVALAAAGIAIHKYNEAQKQMNTKRLTNEFLAAGESASAMAAVLASAADHGPTELIGVFAELAATNTVAAERFIETAEAAGASSSVLDQMRAHLETTGAAQAQTAEDTATATGAFDEETSAVSAAIEALKEYGDLIRAQFDPLFGMLDALHGNAEAQVALTGAQQALNDAVGEFGARSPEATAAELALAEAHRAATGTALDVTAATAGLNAAIAENPALLDSSKAQLATWVAQGLITQATADTMAAQFDDTALRAFALGQTDPNVQVSATDNASGTIVTVAQKLFDLDGRSATVRINEILTRTTFGLFQPREFHQGGIVPGPRGQEVAAILQAGEQVTSLADMDAMSRPMTSAAAFGVGGGGSGGKFELRVSGSSTLAQLLGKSIRTGETQLYAGGKRITVSP